MHLQEQVKLQTWDARNYKQAEEQDSLLCGDFAKKKQKVL